jgi:hypothetical protein
MMFQRMLPPGYPHAPANHINGISGQDPCRRTERLLATRVDSLPSAAWRTRSAIFALGQHFVQGAFQIG